MTVLRTGLYCAQRLTGSQLSLPHMTTKTKTSSSAMAERPRELGNFKDAGHFEA